MPSSLPLRQARPAFSRYAWTALEMIIRDLSGWSERVMISHVLMTDQAGFSCRAGYV
jgi:hypothetical protein